jgi:glycosyltransferase involved in cell wall biosynthesis
VLVGDGPARAALQQRLPQAVFAGLRRDADLAAHYASADLFFFPSLTETFGNVVPEALASGLPVVAYDCAAAGQLVREGESGWLAAPGDEPALRAQACRVITDAAALRRAGAGARQVALRLGWERIVGLVEAEYEAAMQPAAPRLGRVAQLPGWPVRP